MDKATMLGRGFLRVSAVAAAAAAVALTGCSEAKEVVDGVGNAAEQGMSGNSAGELYKESSAFARAATSVEVSMEAGEEGAKQTMTYRGSNDSPDYYMAMSDPSKGEVEILAVDGVSYMKASEEYWTSQGGMTTDLLAGLGVVDRWVKSPEPPQDKPFDVSSIFAEEGSPLGSLSALASEVKEEDFEGQQAFAIRDRVDKDAACVYVSAEDDHHPVAFTGPASVVNPSLTGAAVMRFSNWNNIEPVTAPAAEEVVDLSAG